MIEANGLYFLKEEDKIPDVESFGEIINSKYTSKCMAYRAYIRFNALEKECNDIANKYDNSYGNYSANKISDGVFVVEYKIGSDYCYIPYVVGKYENTKSCMAYKDFDDALIAALYLKYSDKNHVISQSNMVAVINKLIGKE